MEILKKTINNLERIDHVSYISEFKATISNKVYLNYMDSIYFDFASEGKYDVPRYFLNKKEGEVLFNGENLYQSLHKENILIIGSKLSPNNPLLLTLFQLKKVLPKVLKDDQVEIIRQKDTTIQDLVSYKFEIVLPKKTINWDDFSIKKIKVNSNYTLLIDKLNFLPYKIIIPNGPGGMFSRTFENLNYNFKPNDSIWKVSSLYPTYTRISFEDYYNAVKTQMSKRTISKPSSSKLKNIGDWEIPNLRTKEVVNFSNLKGKVVLLEFWFRYCGPCVQAIPSLNKLYNNYKQKGLIFYSIEFREEASREDYLKYADKVNMEYPLLYNGKAIAESQGVTGAPTFIIIDKQGRIIYNKPGFNYSELKIILDKNL